ncbi:hypothetical protein [Roseicella aquatilis]|uniref:TubC N-terminal docking domain-containing protein n=1 Tax=Roseicella aquatilis TaxID=2527868 RepID=A0A4R4DV18_9PROT|nr:hypothetical protein [Roseicella aquatilis]TCZ64303.1 hypothetical protein EXY23_06535 [Roseicella aquatilis]
MNASEALARAEAAGVRLRLRPDGGVRMDAAEPPPADVLADLRRWRKDVAHLLALRCLIAFYERAQADALAALAAPDSDLAAERVVMAQHYSAAPPGESVR